MSNPLAMQLLRQSLAGEGSGGYSGGCGGSGYSGGALLGGGARKLKPLKEFRVPRPSATTADNLARARAGQNIGGMKASQYIALHNPNARAKSAQTRVNTSNLARNLYNDRLVAGNPMSKLEYCMAKCNISAQRRKESARESAARRRVGGPFLPRVEPQGFSPAQLDAMTNLVQR